MPADAATTIRDLRRSEGVTQAQLARRMGTTQPVVARLERPGSNPTLATLNDAFAALGHDLVLAAQPAMPSVDESLIRRQLGLAPAERLAQATRMARQARALELARRAREQELG
jgi:transcriptional regulator with XRE-family HTH domain